MSILEKYFLKVNSDFFSDNCKFSKHLYQNLFGFQQDFMNLNRVYVETMEKRFCIYEKLLQAE